jgi:hypothetical protein
LTNLGLANAGLPDDFSPSQLNSNTPPITAFDQGNDPSLWSQTTVDINNDMPWKSVTDYYNANSTLAQTLYNLGAGGEITFSADTCSAPSYYGSTADIILEDSQGTSMGTLAINTSTEADSLTLLNGLAIALPNIASDLVTLPNPVSALNALTGYLAGLGDALSTSALVALNYAYLNPTGTAYTVTGSVVNVNNTSANVTYAVGGAPGAVATGQSTAVISVNGKNVTVPATNVLVINTEADNNISQDSISNVQTLDATGNVELTSAQFNAFSALTLTGGSGDIIEITTGGTDSLAKVTGTVTDFTATGWDGTTLIGNSQAEQALKASLFGNDTLEAGSGAGDYLFAGEGVDTLVGGSGGDTFYADNGLAAGSVITGNGAGNVESWLAAALNNMKAASAF